MLLLNIVTKQAALVLTLFFVIIVTRYFVIIHSINEDLLPKQGRNAPAIFGTW